MAPSETEYSVCEVEGCFHPGFYRVSGKGGEARVCGDHAEDAQRRGLAVEYRGPTE